jgi:ribosome-associated protein
MNPDELRKRHFESELSYSASRSSGPGGQNVNKVSTKVELRFSIDRTSLFSDYEKEIICKKLKRKINKEMELVLVAQQGRTQLTNKLIVTEKFYELISRALTLPGKRRQSQPTLTSKIKRLETKKIRSNVKKQRNQGRKSDEI